MNKEKDGSNGQTNNDISWGRAIVVGGGIAGLLSARVAADHYAQVTIIERDIFNTEPGARAGVPQARHLHALLPRGVQIMEALFPGLNDEMQAAGAVPLDTGTDVAWLTPQGWGVKVQTGLRALSSSRDLLEYMVRQGVLQLANVDCLQATEVTALLRDGSRIVGVRARERGPSANANGKELAADLIVVTSGRQSVLAQWLSSAGVEQPPSIVINAHIGYASRQYRRSTHQQFPWRGLVLQSAPPAAARGGLMFAIEDNRWQVTLIGGDRDYPPIDETGFIEFARSLRSPKLYEAIRDAEPLTPIHAYRATENRLHRLERINDWPGGLVVMGDAACASNPVYGQGMTTAAIEAAALSRVLAEEPHACHAGKTMRKEIARIVRSPWSLATGADLRYASVEGAKATRQTRLLHRYLDRVLLLGVTDPWARKCFLEVQGMMREASAILSPAMMWRVLFSRHPRMDKNIATRTSNKSSLELNT